MATKEYAAAWEKLSDIQKKVASWDEGPLLVLAGPGSGKTRVLTCRIARILDSTSNKNFRIIGLTFTNKAADEMRSRVSTLVTGQEARLFLGTFHSFCADVLRQHGTHLGINPNFKIYAQDSELQSVLDAVIDKAKKKFDFITDLDKKTMPIIQNLKMNLIPLDRCSNVFKDQDLGRRMGIIYAGYDAELASQNALDFNSLIFKTHDLFIRFPAFVKRYQSVYPYICVDEFQDTNFAQYSLLRAFTGDIYKNIFIVADDDQIIYQWNGASHKRLENFTKDYDPTVIQLPMNYRCPPAIITLANNIISHNFLRTSDKKPLLASQSKKNKDSVRLLSEFSDFDAEVNGVAKDIRNLHSEHLGTVVILGRNRRLLEGAENALQAESLPAVISQRRNEFESTPFVWLHSLLKLANDRQDQKSLEAICGSFAQLCEINIDPEDVITLAKAANRDYLQYWLKLAIKNSEHDVLSKEIITKASLYLGEGRDFQSFSKIALTWFEQIISSRQEAVNDPTMEPFARYHEDRDVWTELSHEILQSLGQDITLEAFLQELQMHSKEPTPKQNTVILMTIHNAKGKEFDHVYIIGLVEDELPSFQSIKKGANSPEMEEERRNCFVAITRTIKTLTLSYANQYRGWNKKPSRFLYEMGLLDK